MTDSAPSAADLTLYDPFDGMRFGLEACFLCGTPTTPPQDTVPVFADWLMDRYQLRERPIKLLDMRIVTYPELRIACCARCRTRHVEPLEAHLEAISRQGVRGFRELDEQTLFLWLGKMFYGILVTELINQQDPLAVPQYPLAENAQMLRRFQAFFQPLQALRVPMEYDDFVPGSVFILETDSAQDDMEFEYDDDLSTLTFSIKLDETVLVACLVDNGIIGRAMGRVYQQARRPLHPVQAAEFKARIYYAAYLLNVVPDYFARPVKPHDQEVVLDSLIDDVTGSIFNPWDNSAYAQSLLEMWKRWQIPLSDILADPALPLSYLHDANGQPRHLERYPATDEE
ncbi:hypothetical protein [Hymenobacter psychrophilus]|uniref:Uncharacterized protein n=1 Tax=Hymenobacter psychrophilus TaxID=651662 RepID=A0A1H3HUE3_9BACT|nr:hypothetical protein [Hymenobacter psychrophilus]SDY19040.1 hypothetical protein SAMN04488069_106154 [Hymenobacter psychrophilus]